MVKVRFQLIHIILFSLCLFTCTEEGNEDLVSPTCDDGIQNGGESGIDCGGFCRDVCSPPNTLSGEIVNITRLFADEENILNGPLLIRDGGQLILNPGTIIKVQEDTGSYIAVAQGGKIFVFGTEDQPVIITSNSENPSPGDWGGLIICGNAPLNSAVVDRSEILDIFYGGNNPEDSSGLIKYLRLEYAGANYNADLVFNGITFYGVGSFTTVTNVQSYMNRGSHFQFVGGTVNASNLIGMNGFNGVSIKDGWNGNIENLYFKNLSNSALSVINNIENENVEPITSGTINNSSFIKTNEALFFGAGGANLTMNNLYSNGLNFGINVSGNNALNAIDNNLLLINDFEIENPSSNFQLTNYDGSNLSFYNLNNATGAGNRDGKPLWAENWTIGF